jgi:hypothetical protein
MGLDIVELFLAVEEGFQIHIEDEEAGRASTVGDLHELVCSKLRGGASNRCFTSAAFYRTRRGIVELLSISRREIRPSTDLGALFHEDSRRITWGRMQEVMGLKMPPLGYSSSTVTTFAVGGLILGIGTGACIHARVAELALAAFIGLIVGGAALRLLPGFAVAFPNREETVGDLARDVLALNQAQFATEFGGWNDREIWETLCRIIVTQTGIERHLIKRGALIVDHLGID